MKRLALGFTLLLVLAGNGIAQAQVPDKLKFDLKVGLGWQLCPKRTSVPPLDTAFMCSGLAATTRKISLELTRKPAAKPEWLYYDATYFETVKFQDITSTVELLVMYAKFDGQTMGFVDGRITSERAGKHSEPVYFRMSAVGGLQNLNYSSAYGAVVGAGAKSEFDFSPYIAVTAK